MEPKNLLLLAFIALLSCGGEEKILGFSGGGPWFPPQVKGETEEEKLEYFTDALKEIGAEWFRMGIPIIAVKEKIDPCKDPFSQLEDGDWSLVEKAVTAFKKKGISLILAIGVGYTGGLPFISEDGCMKDMAEERINPDVIGMERYVELNYAFARIAVRKFKNFVKVWQIENELNVACETVAWGWRDGFLWCDWKFLDALMKSLYKAVKEEDPSLKTTHNFHTDIHFKEDIRRWYEYIDIIGLDAYPNYLIGEPTYGREVGRRVGMVVRLFPEKPVILLETGYPTYPEERRFSEENQAGYIKDAIDSTFENGGTGFLYFTFITSEKDEIRGFQRVEPFWGLIRADGTKKKGYQALKEEFKKWK